MLYGKGALDDEGSIHVKRPEELLGSWDRVNAEIGYGAFAQAASRLATDRSWKKRRGEEIATQRLLLEKLFPPEMRSTEWWMTLSKYEREAAVRHELASGFKANQEYRLGEGSEVKGWSRIRRAWLKKRWSNSSPEVTPELLRATQIEIQKKRPEEMGDHALFDWLAEREHWFLWDGSQAENDDLRKSNDYDFVSKRVRFNRMSKPLAGINWTWTDPIHHPLWVQYRQKLAKETISNCLPIRNMSIRKKGEQTTLVLHLIFKRADGAYFAREVPFRIGANRRLSPGDKPGHVLLDETFMAEFGAAKLQFKRSTLEKIGRSLSSDVRLLLSKHDVVTPEKVESLVDCICDAPASKHRRSLSVYLSIALNIPQAQPPEVIRSDSNFARNRGQGTEKGLARFVRDNRIFEDDLIQLPLRVMGVDLGLRKAACFSILELRDAENTKNSLSREVIRARQPSEGARRKVVFETRAPLGLVGDRGENDPLPKRLDIGKTAIRFAVRSVIRQNQCAEIVRRLHRINADKLTEKELEQERKRLERDCQNFDFCTSVSIIDEDDQQWTNAEFWLQKVFAALPQNSEALRSGILEEKQASTDAAGFLSELHSEAFVAAMERLHVELDKLSILAHRMVRLAMANPNAVTAGAATKARRTARKSNIASAPLTKVPFEELSMGGLSLDRIELLEEQLRFERKFSTRARPGKKGNRLRRLSRGQLFMPQLRERINRIKTDRCKKIAAIIVEAALGGPVNAVTGRRLRAPVHVIAMEDLSRYKVFADRTRAENRKLMAWSHREIFKWVKMMADLHGIIIGSVPAGYSSRFSGLTGAPGMRTSHVKKEWLQQSWWKRNAEDKQKYPGWLEATPGTEVIYEGGPKFVDVGGNRCDADENAAGNIAYRFLSPPTENPIYLRIERQSDDRWKVTTKGVFEGKYFHEETADSSPWWKEDDSKKTVSGRPKKVSEDSDGEDISDVDNVKVRRLFRDATGVVNQGRWTEGDKFWGMVRSMVSSKLKRQSTLDSLES